MVVLFWATLFWLLAFLLHFIVWKRHLPRRQIRALLLTFFAVLFAGCGILWNYPEITLFGITAVPVGWISLAHIVLYFTSLTLAYMITYSALEADSPSLVMVLKIAVAGDAGLPRQVFHEQLNDTLLVEPRLHDLVTDKMVVMDGQRYRLTAKGRWMAWLFIGFRNLLKLDKGG